MTEATTRPEHKAAFEAARAARGAALVDVLRAIKSLFARLSSAPKSTAVASAC